MSIDNDDEVHVEAVLTILDNLDQSMDVFTEFKIWPATSEALLCRLVVGYRTVGLDISRFMIRSEM